MDEINAAVAQMDEMTQKNAALVEETTAATQSLANQANDLRARRLLPPHGVAEGPANLPHSAQKISNNLTMICP
ncbi:MAG TPA: hypothetical protein VD978_34685 [Azospirillum sp.]|nr:hypothetical protein [Azospirillum sp.]